MTSRTRTLTTAWLGLIAMWLIVLAPLVSQLIVAHRAQLPDAPLCTASGPANDAHHVLQDGILTACGYCDLLTTHASIPPIPAGSLLAVTLVVVATVPALFVHFTPAGAFPSGRPRAPPALH